MCYVNQFVLILDEEAFSHKRIHAQLCPPPHDTRGKGYLSIFVFIVPFLVAHVQSDSDDFLAQNTFPFSIYSFLSHFSFPTILIFVLLHCPCSLFLISFLIFSLHTFFHSDFFIPLIDFDVGSKLNDFAVQRPSHKRYWAVWAVVSVTAGQLFL